MSRPIPSACSSSRRSAPALCQAARKLDRASRRATRPHPWRSAQPSPAGDPGIARRHQRTLSGGRARLLAGAPYALAAEHVAEGGVSGVIVLRRDCGRHRLEPGLLADRPGAHHHRMRRQHRDGIDDRPALEVFKEEIGEVLARNSNRAAGYIFAALPVKASDTGDLVQVRNLVDIDPGKALDHDRRPGFRGRPRSCSPAATSPPPKPSRPPVLARLEVVRAR